MYDINVQLVIITFKREFIKQHGTIKYIWAVNQQRIARYSLIAAAAARGVFNEHDICNRPHSISIWLKIRDIIKSMSMCL